jgi:hypothetical protein
MLNVGRDESAAISYRLLTHVVQTTYIYSVPLPRIKVTAWISVPRRRGAVHAVFTSLLVSKQPFSGMHGGRT